MESLRRHPLNDAIAQAGGLLSVSDIARRRDISRQAAHTFTKRDDFPRPVKDGRPQVWLAAEVDAFFATPRPPGRPAS
jgi:predicted DNA-binding transcriptional regulator AlpA